MYSCFAERSSSEPTLTGAELDLRIGQFSHAARTVDRMNGCFKTREEFVVPWGELRTDVLYAWGGVGIPTIPHR